MINESIARKVLEAALETGGDFSELFSENTKRNDVSCRNKLIETASFSHRCGAGVRVLRGGRSAYAYTSDLSEEALIKTARAAAAILKGEQNTHVNDFTHKVYATPQRIRFSDIANDKRKSVLLEAAGAALSYSKEIDTAMVRIMDEERHIEIYNSEGLFSEDTQPRTRLFVSAVAKDSSGNTESGYSGPGHSMGFEAYESLINPAEVGLSAAKTAVLMLHADDCPAMRVPVVIDGGFGGVILHEACVHSLEATAVAKGNSVFCGKLGEKIASDRVTAVDDGTITGEWGTNSIDDEGYPTQRNVLIENGILKSYLVDRIGSRLMNHPMTGSSRRQSYEFAPTSRMNNTFFAPGNDDEEEMIRTMGEGLFATQMGGGSVNPLTGEFCFAVAEGYWVKNGVIQKPVKGATLVGKGAEVLMKIDRVGKKMWLAAGSCGSASGMIPVTVGQPRIRVSEITVGGKGGAL